MKADLTGIERTSRIFIAVLIGILIWISAIDQEMFPVEYRLPVSVNIPEGYMILSTSADSAVVRYTGSGWRRHDNSGFEIRRCGTWHYSGKIQNEFCPGKGHQHHIAVSPVNFLRFYIDPWFLFHYFLFYPVSEHITANMSYCKAIHKQSGSVSSLRL